MRAALCFFFAAFAGASAHAATTFPANFKWCVATAAHQIEGHNPNSDWSRFESEPGRIKRGESSGPTCDHWNRLAQDTALLQELNAKQYRFSIEWAKLEPSEGQFDPAVAAHYREELALLEAAGIEPLVTLNHFTLPLWVADRGGWEWDGIAASFQRYVAYVQKNVGPEVRDWVTINEPTVVLMNGYVTGQFPPGKTDLGLIAKPARNMVRAHALGYKTLHEQSPNVRVGLAHHLRIFDPASRYNPLDNTVAYLIEKLFNWAFMDAVWNGRLVMSVPLVISVDESLPEAKGTQDFLGINYYSRDMMQFELKGPLFHQRVLWDGAETSDMGWGIYPDGMYRLVKSVAERYPGKPIIITENGLADAKDERRAKFLKEHLRALARATQEGVPIEGYCHWSLMDNFEWAEGFEPRFGLYEVDYGTFERKARPSARLFSEIAKSNTVPD